MTTKSWLASSRPQQPPWPEQQEDGRQEEAMERELDEAQQQQPDGAELELDGAQPQTEQQQPDGASEDAARQWTGLEEAPEDEHKSDCGDQT